MKSKRKKRHIKVATAPIGPDGVVRLTADRAYRIPKEDAGYRIGPFRLDEVTRNGRPLKLPEKMKH